MNEAHAYLITAAIIAHAGLCARDKTSKIIGSIVAFIFAGAWLMALARMVAP